MSGTSVSEGRDDTHFIYFLSLKKNGLGKLDSSP